MADEKPQTADNDSLDKEKSIRDDTKTPDLNKVASDTGEAKIFETELASTMSSSQKPRKNRKCCLIACLGTIGGLILALIVAIVVYLVVMHIVKKMDEAEKKKLLEQRKECEANNLCDYECAYGAPGCPGGAAPLWFTYADFMTALVYIRIELDKKTVNMTTIDLLYMHGSAGQGGWGDNTEAQPSITCIPCYARWQAYEYWKGTPRRDGQIAFMELMKDHNIL